LRPYQVQLGRSAILFAIMIRAWGNIPRKPGGKDFQGTGIPLVPVNEGKEEKGKGEPNAEFGMRNAE